MKLLAYIAAIIAANEWGRRMYRVPSDQEMKRQEAHWGTFREMLDGMHHE